MRPAGTETPLVVLISLIHDSSSQQLNRPRSAVNTMKAWMGQSGRQAGSQSVRPVARGSERVR